MRDPGLFLPEHGAPRLIGRAGRGEGERFDSRPHGHDQARCQRNSGVGGVFACFSRGLSRRAAFRKPSI